MRGMFSQSSVLTSLELSNFNTELVQDMSIMFYYANSLAYLNIENFNLK